MALYFYLIQTNLVIVVDSSKKSSLHEQLWDLYSNLRMEKQKEWNRVLPLNELLTDRWEKATFLKWKKGSSVYDNSYVFGNVVVGKNTWIGPMSILDGSGGKLTIGKNCSISAGVQIYTHQTVKWALTGGKAQYEKKSVSIGDHCYIGPYAVIAMGTKIGKCSIIGTHSFVNSAIPPYSIAFGTPARIVGKIKIKNKNVMFNYFDKSKQ